MPLPKDVPAVAALTGAYPAAHGGPIHWGDSALLGIADLAKPTFGDAVRVEPGEVPVFWACGVTPQSALKEAALPLCVTHAPQRACCAARGGRTYAMPRPSRPQTTSSTT